MLAITAPSLQRALGLSTTQAFSIMACPLSNGSTPILVLTAADQTVTYGGTTNSIVISSAQIGTSYILKSVSGTESFTPATLTVTANDASKTYGEIQVLSGYTTNGLLFSDTVSSVVLNSAGSRATANVGTYSIDIAGAGLSNYSIIYNVAPIRSVRLR